MSAFKSVLQLSLFLLASWAAPAFAEEPVSRLINGITATINQIPYIVQLRDDYGGGQFCGGTLVSDRHVVTAAHCFNDRVPQKVGVFGGATTVRDPGVARRIIRVFKHPDYKPPTFHSDLAVIVLDRPMVGPNIAAIPLCQQPLSSDQSLQVSGWGRTVEAINQGSFQLRTVNLPVRPWDVCYKEFGQLVQKNMICASGLHNKGTCIGDSGGPAVYRGQLCGVVAFGLRCGVVGHPGAFTDVYALRGFIQNAMRS